MRRSHVLVVLGALLGCSGRTQPDGGTGDAATGGAEDLGSGPADGAQGAVDLASRADLGQARDLGPSDLALPPDLGFPGSADVDIYVSNTCKMTVTPLEFSVPH